jgi:hypothetical protein
MSISSQKDQIYADPSPTRQRVFRYHKRNKNYGTYTVSKTAAPSVRASLNAALVKKRNNNLSMTYAEIVRSEPKQMPVNHRRNMTVKTSKVLFQGVNKSNEPPTGEATAHTSNFNSGSLPANFSETQHLYSGRELHHGHSMSQILKPSR